MGLLLQWVGSSVSCGCHQQIQELRCRTCWWCQLMPQPSHRNGNSCLDPQSGTCQQCQLWAFMLEPKTEASAMPGGYAQKLTLLPTHRGRSPHMGQQLRFRAPGELQLPLGSRGRGEEGREERERLRRDREKTEKRDGCGHIKRLAS